MPRLGSSVPGVRGARSSSGTGVRQLAIFVATLALLVAACGGQGGTETAAPGTTGPGAESPGAQSPGAQSPGAQSPGAESPGAQSPPIGEATPLATAAQPSPAELAGGGPEIATTIQPPEQGADITIWNHFTGPDGSFFRALVDRFNEEQQQCRATSTVQPGGVFNQAVISASLGGQMPHVLAGGYDRIPFLSSEGLLVPIDDLAEQAGFSEQTFPAAIWNSGVYAGERFGIPLDTHPAVFFYNKALFEQAGLDSESPPADQQAFETAIQTINEQTDADGYQMVGSGPGANFLVGLQFATLFYQGGGEWTNEEFTEATYNSEAGIQAAEYLAHLVNDLNVPLVESDQEIAAFAAGDNAMVLSGIWESTRYAEALGDDLGIGQFPSVYGQGTWGGSHQLMVTRAVEGDDAARQCAYYFIDWLSANSYNWAEGGQVPARNEVREAILNADPESLNPTLQIIQQVAPIAETVQFLPTIPSGGDLLFGGQGAGESAVRVVNGENAQEVLDASAQFYTQRLQEDKEFYQY